MKSNRLSPIISASRRTDIPAFYAEWMTRRLDAGYALCANPYSGKVSRVELDSARFFVFWTKHPAPRFSEVLARLDSRGVGYYVLYTLNDYETEGFEPGVPDLRVRLETFVALSNRIGADRVVWRFDPLVLTPALGVAELLGRIETVGRDVHAHTRRMIFSFMDAAGYRRVRRNLASCGVVWREWEEERMRELAGGLCDLNRSWGLDLTTCCEPVDLRRSYGILHGKCIDDDLIRRVSPEDPVLHSFLSSGRSIKDRGQREACGCIASRDIGRYDTCPMGCAYCYASSRGQTHHAHHDPDHEMIGG